MQVTCCRICVRLLFTRLHGGGPLAGEVRTKLYDGPGSFYQITQRQRPTRERWGLRILGAAGGKWASATIHSLTTRLHGVGGEATLLPLSLRTLKTYREGGLWRYFYKTDRGLARACYQTVRRLSSLSLSLTPMTTTATTTTTTAAAAAAAAASFNIIITHLLHSHIHCDLDYSCSKLTLHNLHFFINPRKLHFSPPREIFPSTYTSTLLVTLLLFKSPAFFFQTYRHLSNLPREVREVTWPGKWRG